MHSAAAPGRIAARRQLLVKAFAPKTRFACDIGHAFGACNVSQRGCYQRGVIVFQRSFEIRNDVLPGFQVICRIPRFRFGLCHNNLL